MIAIILSVLLGLTIVPWVVWPATGLAKRIGNDYPYVLTMALTSTFAGTIALVLSLMILVGRAEDRSNIVRYRAFTATIEAARARGESIESAALLKDIAKWNERIASARYWNEGWTDQMVVDEFAELPFIE